MATTTKIINQSTVIDTISTPSVNLVYDGKLKYNHNGVLKIVDEIDTEDDVDGTFTVAIANGSNHKIRKSTQVYTLSGPMDDQTRWFYNGANDTLTFQATYMALDGDKLVWDTENSDQPPFRLRVVVRRVG
ncbi:MAG: hypothetical protein AAF799_25210 [Myxococcota bacterium]